MLLEATVERCNAIGNYMNSAAENASPTLSIRSSDTISRPVLQIAIPPQSSLSFNTFAQDVLNRYRSLPLTR